MEKIIRQFFHTANILSAEQLTGGVIHQTFKIKVDDQGQLKHYILQRFNKDVFKNPDQVMQNIVQVQEFLIEKEYPLELSVANPTVDYKLLFVDENGAYWRCFNFISNSISFERPVSNDQLFHAGKAFGVFASFLKDFDAAQLKVTIPDFHNLQDRFKRLLTSLEKASEERLQKSKHLTDKVARLFKQFQSIDFSTLPIRAVHNDCKLSNLLFDNDTLQCKAVIDLDTMMPGYVVTDFGDMVRTMCCTATEDERDLTKVSFDQQAFEVLKDGFLNSTNDWLTDSEKENLVNGAIYIILEQAIRFLSDYLNNDQYYRVQYPDHNFDRTKNQLKLLTDMLVKI